MDQADDLGRKVIEAKVFSFSADSPRSCGCHGDWQTLKHVNKALTDNATIGISMPNGGSEPRQLQEIPKS